MNTLGEAQCGELPPVSVRVYFIYSSCHQSPTNQEPQSVNKMRACKGRKHNMCIMIWAGRHFQVLLDAALIKAVDMT